MDESKDSIHCDDMDESKDSTPTSKMDKSENSTHSDPPEKFKKTEPITSTLVGRSEEVKRFKSFLAALEKRHYVNYWAMGGLGKTCLMQKLQHIVGEAEREVDPGFDNTGIIDLYHTDTHSSSDVERAIVNELDPEHKYFAHNRREEIRAPSPTLSAIMCDGMGWFSKTDYKRMLLTYDKIYYVLPQNSVEFEDITGAKQFLHFPIVFKDDPSFKVHHFVPDEKMCELILTASQIDLTNSKFLRVLEAIPKHELIYTWQVVNTDGDLGAGRSIGLAPDQTNLAHAILLNKFLLAADTLNCIPITGKSYVHGLISEKYRFGLENVHKEKPELLPPSLKLEKLSHNPIITRIISALVPDEELEKRTEVEIIKFKEKNRDLFERYSYVTRNLVRKISVLPLTPEFDLEVEELINTEVWKEKAEIETELRSAWKAFFKSAITSTVSGLVAIGIAPFLSLSAITLATVATATTAITPWALSELINFIESRKKAKKHGLYYLLKFAK